MIQANNKIAANWIKISTDLQSQLIASEEDKIKLLAENNRLREALNAARRAIGDHFAPDDCYATGPITGDPFRDLVDCPACSFIAIHAALQPKEGEG
jgi:hypothetical protein